MKKIKAILMSAIICGLCCSCNSSTTTVPVQTSKTEETTLSAPETTAVTTAVTTTAKTETTTATTTTAATKNTTETPIQSEYIDENGYLTEEFSKRVQLFIDSYVDRTASGAILTLQDFDFDNVPEIVYTAHDGGQQEKESKVYRAEDFHYYGSFDGFCRDGYTKFFNKYDGVIIHNFCEHSNQLRSDRYTHAIIEDDKLITTEIGSNDQVMQAGRLNDEIKINDELFEERNITNPKHVVNILENEEYSITINEMAATAFADVIRGLIGATYIPVLYCGEQFVNGTNYMIICKQIIATKGNPEHIISMMINSSAQGNRIIQLEEII